AGGWYWQYGQPNSTPVPSQGQESKSGEKSSDVVAESKPPEELMSNEEKVIQLLEENGGRVKQQTIYEELGWTEAKTSQVLSGMREDGQVEVFRIGRENVVRLPEEDDDSL
ncbi:MAG: helix-turn-helix transcriptional regulator, partial [Halobacteriaceae archaeon]